MEEPSERKFLARFEKYDRLLELQNKILAMDNDRQLSRDEQREEALLENAVQVIFAEYQEQSFLLDPFLEGLVTPVVEKLKTRAALWVDTKPDNIPSTNALHRLAFLLYQYIKFRGHKMIVRFFPHEVSDLELVVGFMRFLDTCEGTWLWSLQYVTLLWMSLICMLPFDLSQFDEPGQTGKTASEIEYFGQKNLGRSGLEREGAALLLSRLYARKDVQDRIPQFLAWVQTVVSEERDVFKTIGAIQTLSEVMKNAPAAIVIPHVPAALALGKFVESGDGLMKNAIVRKLRVKLISRAGLRLLPATPIVTRRKGQSSSIIARDDSQGDVAFGVEDDFDVPEEIEGVLEDVFPALQDRDTIVRWASAKAVARICERLPSEFTGQVVSSVLGLFSIHSIGVASLYDMPAIAESTWQGACLACAELARRSLIPRSDLPALVDWMLKAFAFDIRKGAHSVGSSVRDAAAYVLWSLARAYDPSTLQPFCDALSKKLVTMSVYDREVHIRRAASATFQEHVGRTGLFSDGIDVLRKTDFFVVGVRRNAFLVSAPQVAEHVAYRSSLIDHALSITVRHWDPSVRELAAQSLRRICELDLRDLGSSCAGRARKLLSTTDAADIHGALLVLTELASAFRDAPSDLCLEAQRQEIFSYLADVPFETIQSPRNELVTRAACLLIASSISLAEIRLEENSSVKYWRKVIDAGLKHRVPAVQEAAANALGEVSKLVDCSSTVRRYQQSLARLLGVLDYTAYPHALPEVIDCLLESVNNTSRLRMTNVEARRNCYVSIPQIVARLSAPLPTVLAASQTAALFDALIGGLEDYTVDERGDVGSWARIACLRGLPAFVARAASCPDFADRLPPARYHAAVAGVLKQGVERLDNVRQQAGEAIGVLLKAPLPDVAEPEPWRIRGVELLHALFIEAGDASGWQEAQWLFPRAVRLLEIAEYRDAVLSGLLLSVSSRTDSTQRPVATSLVAYVRTLPVAAADGALDLRTLVDALVARARKGLTSNNTVIPVLQLFNVLLEADALAALSDDAAGSKSLDALLQISTRGVARLKNVQRIHACMKTVVNLLNTPALYAACVPRLADFLTHTYPRIRADTAEYLYQVLQSRDFSRDTDGAENLLLETEWMTDAAGAAAAQLVALLRE
ncbi:TBCD protein [Vararia minispora EC-137]|uniref:TBCD protein n=1 Tax=Vararia minispora EC-137 TaxID=1314806 RepID=A0ACB8QI21_9AGAM|nr:TBCD protein [Vararia minispora EC-137]